MQPETFQKRFMDELWSSSAAVPRSLFADTEHVEAAWRIYRNNVYHSLTEVLRDSYPVVERLLGPGRFSDLAAAFIPHFPPQDARMHVYGQAFPQFLADKLDASLGAWVSDVARLEWLFLSCQHAADSTREELAVDPEDLLACRLRLAPSLRCFRSVYPALDIWHSNRIRERRRIRLDQGGQAAILVRPVDEVQIIELPAASISAIERLRTGQALGEALAEQPVGDAVALFQTLLQNSAITSIYGGHS